MKIYWGKAGLLFLVFLIIGEMDYVAAQSITGKWKGAIQIQGRDLIIINHFTYNDDRYSGTIDIPQQMADGIRLQELKITSDSVHYEFPAGLGRAYFNGKFESSDSIKGTFSQSGQFYPFYLNREKLSLENKSNIESYKELELVLSHDSLEIGGTLTEPKTGKKYPLLILISGSGAQNRDEEIFGFKPFEKIADYLTTKGIAVFRYDDRGIGQSTGNLRDITIPGLAKDVRVILDSLQNRPEINKGEIGLLGHSEGGEVATYLAVRDSRISYLILMSSPAYSGSDIILQQIKTINEKMGVPDSITHKSIIMEKKVLHTVTCNKGWNMLKKELVKMTIAKLTKLPKDKKEKIGNLNIYADKLVNAQINQIRNNHFRSFVNYDPAIDLKKLKIPVLVFFGQKDTQVEPNENKKRMEICLQKSDALYKIEVIPDANHLYQKAINGLPTEYATLKRDFTPGFLDSLNNWIQKNVIKK